MKRSQEQAARNDEPVEVATESEEKKIKVHAREEVYLREEMAKMKCHGLQLTDRFAPDNDDKHSYAIFHNALVQALDVDPLIVAQVGNLDRLREPETREDQADVNCAQLLTLDDDGTESIENILSFMVDTSDRDDEPHEHSPLLQMAIRATLVKIAVVDKTAAQYFEAVSRRLWRKADYLASHMPYHMDLLQARLDALAQGLPCVFDRLDDDGKPVFV